MKFKDMSLNCSCGGHMVRFASDVAFRLTDTDEIVFNGICNRCGQVFHVPISIPLLWLDCPNNKRTS